MNRGTPIILWTLAAALPGGCGTQELLLGTRGSYLFTTVDALATPGQEVDLRAQFRSGDFLRGSPGYAVRFYRDGAIWKVAETDSEGTASVSFTPAAPGDYEFTAVLAPVGLAEEPPEPRKLLVACRPPDTPIVVVDLDKTVVASGFHTVLVGTPEPMPDSQAVLKRLAETHAIVYLTHRPDYLSIRTKDWLRQQGYPGGVVLLSTTGGFLKGSGEFKSAMLADLKKRFGRIEIGIGDKVSDAQAYRQNGLRTFLLLPPPPQATPEAYEALAESLQPLDDQVQVVGDWRQIQDVLFGGATFGRSAMQQRLRKLAESARQAATRGASQGASSGVQGDAGRAAP